MVASGQIAERIRALPIMSGQDYTEGFVALPPCKPYSELESPETPWQQAGRPCPFVGLSPANRQAADVVHYGLFEHTRGLAELYAETVAESIPVDDRPAFLERILAAIDSEPVRMKLFPRPPGEAPDGV